MNQKEMTIKHAVKKAMAVLRIMFTAAIVFGSHSTLMTVHAVNEMQIPPEEMAEEGKQETENGSEEPVQEPAANTEEPQTQEENAEDAAQTQEEMPTETMSVTMIGDSVLLGAAPSIQEMLPDCVINAKIGRQVKEADDVLDSLEAQNALGQIVVMELGTNGPFSVEKGQELIDRLGSGRTVYWVTVYGRDLVWQEESNATIRELAANNENVHLIDWSQAVSEHAQWLCSDGIHLSTEGRSGFAGVVLGGLL